ncbi:MAG: hypothetical protein ABSA97_06380 [Verrucomicrobiia bacterium]
MDAVDMEKVLPIATTKERQMRFVWETLPSTEFLMNWNQCLKPNSMFIEEIEEQGKFRRCGIGGRHL